MVRPPKIRHSKPRKDPVTIELGPEDVSRIEEPGAAPAEMPKADPDAGEADAAGPTPPAAADDAAPAATETESVAAHGDAEPAAAVAPDLDPEAPSPGPDRSPSEDENTRYMGSEWPPEPDAAATPPEHERIRHAFGRDADVSPSSSAGSDAASAEPIPQAPPQRRGTGALVAAGIVGGLIVLVGGGGLQWAGLLPLPGGSGAPAVVDGDAIAGLKAELAALRQEIEAAKPGGDATGLTQSVAELQASVQSANSALDQAKADIAGLKDAIEKGAGGDGAAVAALSQKMTALESSVATLRETVSKGSTGDAAAVQALDEKLAALAASVAALQQAGVTQASLDAVDQKVAALEAGLASAGEASKESEARIGALEQNVKGLSEQLAQQAAQPKVALAIAAAALNSAIERGGTFAAEVETLAAIAPDVPELPALREIAAQGIATQAELVAGMDDAANAMIAAAEAPDRNSGFWDQLWSSMESLVQVRPIGNVQGDTVPAKVARMEVALKAGDLAKVAAEFETLPDAAKAAGQPFVDKVKARQTAQDLVAKALAGALKPA